MAGCRERVEPAPVETSDCGVIYYSRYYRIRPGFELPDGPWLLSPRGDLGYLGFASFPGDNGTFAALLAVPTGVPAWRAFKDADVFDAAVARIPALRAWVDPEGVDATTAVMAMAGLRNTLRDPDSTSVGGLAPVGDALQPQRSSPGARTRVRPGSCGRPGCRATGARRPRRRTG